jgi:hypothetical protein
MSLQQRQAYNVIKNAYAKAGRKPVTTASTLRLIQPIVANRTNYTFPILEGDAITNFPEQILLNRADAFTAIQVGLFIGGIANDGANATTASYQLFPYPGAPLITAGMLNTNALFSHSYLNIAVNNVQYLQNFDTFRMFSANVIQTGNILATGGSAIAPNSIAGNNDGFTSVTPSLQFSGTAKIDISIKLPEALSFTAARTPNIQLIFRGFLSLGASNLNR